jgi:beta-lactamase regulating signal transducer with metallopeptidase domain
VNPAIPPAVSNKPHEYAPPVESIQKANAIQIADIINIVLISGSVIFFATILIIHLKHRRVYATSLPCEEEIVTDWTKSHKLLRKYSVRTLDTITSPITYGLFKPVILLPTTLDFSDKNQIECILYHEFIHIKRFDVLWKLAFLAALSLHWFNPLVWIAFILMNRDIELSCDEGVIKNIGSESKSKYAEMLIDLTQRRRAPFLLFNAFSTNATKERVRSIMKFKKTTITGVVASIAIVASSVAVFATSAAVPEQDSYAEILQPVNPAELIQLAETDESIEIDKPTKSNKSVETEVVSETLAPAPVVTAEPAGTDRVSATEKQKGSDNKIVESTKPSKVEKDEPIATEEEPPTENEPTISTWEDELTNYLEIPKNSEVITKYVKTYSKGFAFFLITHSPVVLENEPHEIGGHSFMVGKPTLYFYVSETSTFLQVALHNESELLKNLTTDEIGDLSLFSAQLLEQNFLDWYIIGINN